jgi:uncharacterized protein YgbK (DUF1537 family)
MTESDIRVHLRRQTKLTSGLVVSHIADPRPVTDKVAGLAGTVIRLFDVADDEDLRAAGVAIAAAAASGQAHFVVGSSAVEYALASQWWAAERSSVGTPLTQQVGRVLILSGSCSSISADQIRRALHQGFREIALDPTTLRDPSVRRAAQQKALAALRGGYSVVVHSALGPDDRRVADGNLVSDLIGSLLADITEVALQEAQVERVVVVGGDTSSAVARGLGIKAVDAEAAFIPGAPLCRAHAPKRAAHGAQCIFKGGSLGGQRVLEAAVIGVSSG